MLAFEKAKVRPAAGSHTKTPRPRHDIAPNGELHPRPEHRKHDRLCRSDLETIMALRKVQRGTRAAKPADPSAN